MDFKRPIFIPYGYTRIGKTLVIVRLSRYLLEHGYHICPELTFSNNPRYPDICRKYIESIYDWRANVVLVRQEPILLSVLDSSGKEMCYLLDMAGERQYDINNPHFGISQQMYSIVKLPNPKIWGFMIEFNNWLNQQQRKDYVQNIRKMVSIAPRNKVLFIYNKVDQTPFVYGNGKVLWRALFDSAESSYPGIFNTFERKNSLLRILKGKYSFRMTPFQTFGFYDEERITLGPNIYPKQLWHNILECTRE